jgi:hypothetical protein
MALIQGNLNTFKRALNALEKLGYGRLGVDAPGQDVKVRAAIARGDKVPAEPIRTAIAQALRETWSSRADPREMADAIEDAVEDAVSSAIRSGLVKGPPRKTKTGNKLFDTGDLADSIRCRVRR